ncbi:MAG: urocanate hydratase, partial [Tissierellia bacterium]|nr:urocanate hydratase [Tissierellia bacterium]
MWDNKVIEESMVIKLDNYLPEYPKFNKLIRRAPKREFTLTQYETEIALKNALRYVPEELHDVLAPEFLEELLTTG